MIPRVGTCTKLAAKMQDTHRKGLELTLAGPNDCQYTPQKCAGKRSTWHLVSLYSSTPALFDATRTNGESPFYIIDDAMYLLSEQTFPMGQHECQNSADFCSNPGIMMGINQKPELC